MQYPFFFGFQPGGTTTGTDFTPAPSFGAAVSFVFDGMTNFPPPDKVRFLEAPLPM
tara:strand:+ start:238 stop:405 length:168 start_codon:yes stop_codon:yes gene_type:complete